MSVSDQIRACRHPVGQPQCSSLLPNLALILLLALIVGCASSKTVVPETGTTYMDRAQTQSEGPVRVTAAVPSANETEKLFGAPLYKNNLQPVWLEIENKGASRLVFLPVGLDSSYFSPTEAAYLAQEGQRQGLDPNTGRLFYDEAIGLSVPAGGTQRGFVFSNLDEGTKAFNVDLVSDDQRVYSFTFFIPVPGLRLDHHTVDWDNVYASSQWQLTDDTAALIEALEGLPCCTTDKKGEDQGDPLNLVVIGDADDVYKAFLRAGWDETETIYGGSLLKTVASFFSGGEYRYSPVSGLYVFDRSQDFALQKARDNIHERNHLRLWLTPVRYRGEPVWIGQISRDIGVRFTTRTITTHKIDPDVDETREFLLEDLAYAQGLAAYAYVGGVGAAPIEEPRANLTGDPYFTDGYRIVLWVSADPVSIPDVEVRYWRDPGAR